MWNDADKGQYISVSGNVAVGDPGAAGWSAVRGITSHSTGKWYFEIEFASNDVDHVIAGFADGSFALTQSLGNSNGGGLSVGVYISASGAVTLTANAGSYTQVINSVTIGASVRIGVAIDFDALTVDFYVDGALALYGTYPASFVGTPLFPAVSLYRADASLYSSATVLQTKPIGFGAWDGIVAAISVSGMSSYSELVLSYSPSVYYKFDETGGTVIADSSGNGRHGEIVGPAVIGQPSLLQGDPGGASIAVAGNSAYIMAANGGFDVSGDFAVLMWVNGQYDFTAQPRLLYAYDSVSKTGYMLVTKAVGVDVKLHFNIWYGQSLEVGNIAHPTTLQNNETYFIALRRVGDVVRLTVNDVTVSFSSMPVVNLFASSATAFLGISWNFNPVTQFSGAYDHLSVIRSTVSDSELNALYVAGITSPSIASASVSGMISLGPALTPVARRVIAISANETDTGKVDSNGDPIFGRIVLADAMSAADGTYTLGWSEYSGDVIVVAIDNWGNVWVPNASYSIGSVIHPTAGNETGYVYECIGAGISDATEPAWWIDDGSSNTGMVGTATFQARQYYRPLAHGPVTPSIASSPGGDQYWANVVALLHFDGSNGSVSMIEQTGKSVAVYGDAVQSDTQVMFGTAALSMDGAGDYISLPDSPDFDLSGGDFTIELWVYSTNPSDESVLVRKGSGYDPFNFRLYLGSLTFYGSTTGSSWNVTASGPAGSITASVWHHIAAVMSAGTLRVYVDGVGGSPTAVSNPLISNASPVTIGASANGQYPFAGFIDEVRITKGVARYTSDFTPPDAPFPDQ